VNSDTYSNFSLLSHQSDVEDIQLPLALLHHIIHAVCKRLKKSKVKVATTTKVNQIKAFLSTVPPADNVFSVTAILSLVHCNSKCCGCHSVLQLFSMLPLSIIRWLALFLCTYLTNVRWLQQLPTVLSGLLTIKCAWSRDHAISLVTTVLPPPGTVCLNSFGNWTSPSDN